MAEGVDPSGQLDNNNLQDTGDTYSRLNVHAFLSEFANLKKEIHCSNITVVSEVKNLKSEGDVVWRLQSNEILFDFNSDLVDIVKQSIWAPENAKFGYCKEQLCELADKAHKRSKLIRIADRLQAVAGKLCASMNRIRLPVTVKMRVKFTKQRGERLNARDLVLVVGAVMVVTMVLSVLLQDLVF